MTAFRSATCVLSIIVLYLFIPGNSARERLVHRASTSSPSTTLVPFTFEPLPLGSIKPQGWINDQLGLMAHGLAGHEYDFYPIVHNSPWLGGNSEYSALNEGLPYWFNGLVPLAYGLNDTRLQTQVHDASDYIVAHQQNDGWLGPEVGAQRDIWARFPLFLGLLQLVEADPTRAPKIIPAMHAFVNLMHSMLIANTAFTDIWGKVRYPDMLISLQWLYEKHPENNAQILLETMSLLNQKGFDWSAYWSPATYLFADLDTVQPPITPQSPFFPFTHGVNAAQGLKAGAAIYRFTANQSLIQTNRDAVNWTFTYHGDPAGNVIGDERESSVSPNRGSELCTAVETMYSLSYLHQTFGDLSFADSVELAAFNALPVSITSDHWARQYLALSNEPVAEQLNGSLPFWNVGTAGIIYGLEPNYPCCTVNMPQGLPKYLSKSFVLSGQNSIAHALLGPTEVVTTLPSNTGLTITCLTNYPFSSTLHYNIASSAPFTLLLRVPAWALSAKTSITLNNTATTAPLTPDLHTGMHAIPLSAGTSTLTYTIPITIRTVPRANNTIAIYAGALLYALDVGQTLTYLPPDSYSKHTPTQHSVYSLASSPPEAHDVSITNTEPWNIAIDPSTLTFHATNPADNEPPLPNPIFDYKAPPTYITAKGCEIDWPIVGGIPRPLGPVDGGKRSCTGIVKDVVLRPYGSLKVHMAVLPMVDLAGKV